MESAAPVEIASATSRTMIMIVLLNGFSPCDKTPAGDAPKERCDSSTVV
jgi:hypothetical protein